jgi:hypothetical protein
MAITAEKRRAYDKKRYAEDSEYREKVIESRKAYYQANKERIKARTRAYRVANPRQSWAYNLKRYEGMTIEVWDEMLIAQSGRCAICNDPMTLPHVDHCHATGKVRGLLCPSCNKGLGHMRDDIENILRAAAYLRR